MKKMNFLYVSGLGLAALATSAYTTVKTLPAAHTYSSNNVSAMENSIKLTPPDNTLTEAEKKAGWKLLFDGKSTKGWHTYLKPGDVSDKWKVENGTLTLTGGGAGDIITDEAFEDFELELEWKIAEGGNSGIMYHVHEDPKFKATYATGPEMQVLDDDKHPDAKQGKNGNRTAGSLYDMLPPTKKATKPVGQFNKVKLVIKDGKATHYMNGVKTVEYATTGAEWEKMVADSKFKGWEGFGKYSKGHIALQDHGDVVTFKNIKIRPL